MDSPWFTRLHYGENHKNPNSPFIIKINLNYKGKGVVGWEGLEPSTNALKGHCSTD